MKILTRTCDFRPRGHVVGCGVQGSKCLALGLSAGKGGKLSIGWSLDGELGDPMFAEKLSKLTGARHFWASPSEQGGLQVETTRTIEMPAGEFATKSGKSDYFVTQIKSRFVKDTVVIGGLCMKGEEIDGGRVVPAEHNVGAGAIKESVNRDYRYWYSTMGISRPHIASTALALANAYLALYPAEKRRANPFRLVLLKGRSVYRAVLMDDWKYIDEVLLPRMDGDDASPDVIAARMQGWIDYFTRQHPAVVQDRTIDPLVVAVKETHVSSFEHWDLWDENAIDKIDMTEAVAGPILSNRDIAPIAFGMALQGGC